MIDNRQLYLHYRYIVIFRYLVDIILKILNLNETKFRILLSSNVVGSYNVL